MASRGDQMSIKRFFKGAAAGILAFWIVIEEMPAVKRILSTITGIDFIYEKTRDPSWMGSAYHLALNPPPGTAILVVVVSAALIYWTTKPREIRMLWPVLGMLASVICFAVFGVVY